MTLAQSTGEYRYDFLLRILRLDIFPQSPPGSYRLSDYYTLASRIRGRAPSSPPMALLPDATFWIPGIPRPTTRLGLGGAPTGGHGWGPRDDASALAAILEAGHSGVTLFDTADVYGLGLAEELLGQALSDRSVLRESAVVATKGGVAWDASGRTRRDSSPRHLRSALEGSLRRLRTDCIDLYYLHWMDGRTPVGESIGALTRFRDEGKVRAIGICNVLPSDLADLGWSGLAAVQVKGNLLEPGELLAVSPTARSIGAAVICSSALADGLLGGSIGPERRFEPDDHRARYPLFQPGTFERALERVRNLVAVSTRVGRSPASVAIRWLLQSGLADAALTGTTSRRHIRENAESLTLALNQTEMAELASTVPIEAGDALAASYCRRGAGS